MSQLKLHEVRSEAAAARVALRNRVLELLDKAAMTYPEIVKALGDEGREAALVLSDLLASPAEVVPVARGAEGYRYRRAR